MPKQDPSSGEVPMSQHDETDMEFVLRIVPLIGKPRRVPSNLSEGSSPVSARSLPLDASSADVARMDELLDDARQAIISPRSWMERLLSDQH